MIHRSIFHALWAVPLLLCTSCEDKELVEQRDRQALEIRRLEAELSTEQAKLGEPVPNRTREVAAAEKRLAETKAEIVRIEDEVAKLRDEKRKLEKEFTTYRRKYPLSGGGGE